MSKMQGDIQAQKEDFDALSNEVMNENEMSAEESKEAHELLSDKEADMCAIATD